MREIRLPRAIISKAGWPVNTGPAIELAKVGRLLDPSHEVNSRSQRLLSRPPISWADFALMAAHKDRRLKFSQDFVHASSDAIIVKFVGSENSIRINNKTCTQRNARFFDICPEIATELGRRIGNHGILNFLDRRRLIVPRFMHKRAVRAHAENFSS